MSAIWCLRDVTCVAKTDGSLYFATFVIEICNFRYRFIGGIRNSSRFIRQARIMSPDWELWRHRTCRDITWATVIMRDNSNLLAITYSRIITWPLERRLKVLPYRFSPFFFNLSGPRVVPLPFSGPLDLFSRALNVSPLPLRTWI